MKSKKVSNLREVRRRQPKGAGRIISAQSARIIERRNSAFKMRRDGYTLEEIASVLSCSPATVADDLRTVLGRMAKETAIEVDMAREMEGAIYDSITKSFMPMTRERLVEIPDPKDASKTRKKVIGPDPTAAELVMKASAHRRKLMALDKPELKRLEVSAIREYVGVDMDKV